ncbi:unnamed protein product [Didymodactylos carnosus]|uniref:Peptidase C14 caspase domain-containing protein n=1 Tax=Didymodactylos carnosus TaxID=1234261 RepID=A0A8S2EF14_9BILA|nr:unnamed protein product [Didymodactylos carnosus]CAF4019627.1 unnamed protein product [Didymodactylos carnosus]
MGFILYENEAKSDLAYEQMGCVITDFECSIEEGDTDQNYLIPMDNYIEELKDGTTRKVPLSGPELFSHAIHAQTFLNSINDRKPLLTLFFLDCSRRYPLHNELQKNTKSESINYPHGLKPIHPKVGTLIAFACAPRIVADNGNNGEKNGLFTKHLLKQLGTPDEDI